MQYGEYLKTDHWKLRRNEFKSNTHFRCFICRSKNVLDVHHKRYARNGKSVLFNEKHTDLRLLCRTCHSKLHKNKLEEYLRNGKIRRRKLRDFIKNLQ